MENAPTSRESPHRNLLSNGEGTISILIPMRNAEAWITSTLKLCLTQRNVDFEIIIIDDGSTDRSVEVVRSMNDSRIRIIPGPQKGISAAFNAGLAEAKGQFLARCDADDLYPPDRLAWQVEFLKSHPDFGAVCGHFATIDEHNELISDHYEEFPAEEITQILRDGKSRSHMCAYLFRTDILRRIGGCREWFLTSEDADLQFRLAETTRIWFEPKRAYLYRLHSTSITHQQKAAERKFFERKARDFQLQRQQTGKDALQLGTPPPVEADPSAPHPLPAKQQIQDLLISKSWREHKLGAKSLALRTGWRAMRRDASRAAAWKSLFALLLKPSRKQ